MSLRQRELGKVAELSAAGEPASLPTVGRMRRRYRSGGLIGLVDGRLRRGADGAVGEAQRPNGPFGAVTVLRPGEWCPVYSTPLDVRVVLDDGLVDRAELRAAAHLPP